MKKMMSQFLVVKIKRLRQYIYLTSIILGLQVSIFHILKISDDKKDIEDTLLGVDDYSHGIQLGRWTNSNHIPYNEVWGSVVTMLKLPTGCNAVDIGANDGKTKIEIRLQ